MRDVLQEFDEYWASILTVLSIICPRPISRGPQVELSPHEVEKSAFFGCFPSRSKKDTTLKSSEKNIQKIRPKLKEKDYGPPKHGMTKSVWSLIVQTKLIIEDLMDILGLTEFSDSLLLLSEEAKQVAEDAAVSNAIRAKVQQSRQKDNMLNKASTQEK